MSKLFSRILFRTSIRFLQLNAMRRWVSARAMIAAGSALFVWTTPVAAQDCPQILQAEEAAAVAYNNCMKESLNGAGPCEQQKITYLGLAAALKSCQHPLVWNTSSAQPDIKQGGRVNTIAVDPSNNQHVIVASESGGLFVSTNGGGSWSHVDTFPQSQTYAVAFLSANPKIVIATANSDFAINNGGGIWMSQDGGANWNQIPSPQAPQGAPNFWVYQNTPLPSGQSAPMSALEISIAPDTGNIYVASNYGVSIGTNQGANWTLVQPFGAGNPLVSTVLAQSNGQILAGGPPGVMRSPDGGAHWYKPSANINEGISDLHAFGRSPFSSSQAFAVDADTAFYHTEDGGDHWTKVGSAPSNSSGGCGGISFVKTVGHKGGRMALAEDQIDIYYSDECNPYRLTATRKTGQSNFDYSGSWNEATVDHSDSRDMAFNNQNVPVLLGTDGGLHSTSDGGKTWSYIGGGHSGYDALQVTEVKGQVIDSLSRHDLYFGTQDNDMWSSINGGSSWQDGGCCEGFDIWRQYHVDKTKGDQVTYVTCASCTHQISGADFSNPSSWNDAPNADGSALTITPSFVLQAVGESKNLKAGYAFTANQGSKWSQYATLSDNFNGTPQGAWTTGATQSLVLYQGVQTGSYQSSGEPLTMLARMTENLPQGNAAPTATVTYPTMNNFGGLGINPTMFAWYEVFAVDPGNPDHLIAPDIVNGQMMQTIDGGNNWSPIPQLTSLVTGNGAYAFSESVFPMASVVSFDPDEPQMVAVGTWETGIFVSNDGGADWTAVPGSRLIPRITAFDWMSPNSLVVSSYGRGLWFVNLIQQGLTSVQMAKRDGTPAVAQAAENISARTVSPYLGKPRLDLETGNIAGNRIAYAGKVIMLSGQAHLPGSVIEILLDRSVIKRTSVGRDGNFSLNVTAPRKQGMHMLAVIDAATGKVISGAMFIVTNGDEREKEH